MDHDGKYNGNNGNTAHDVLRLLFENGPMEQLAAAKCLGITKAAGNLHFQRLIADNFIEPVKLEAAGRGRPASLWRVLPAHCFLGIVLQKSGIFAELLDVNGNSRYRCNVELKPEAMLAEVQAAIDQILTAARARIADGGRLLQCFIGVPGAIAKDGTILNSPNFPVLNFWNPDRSLADKGITPYTDTIGMAVCRGESSDTPRDAVMARLDWSEGFGAGFMVNGETLLLPAPAARRYHGLWDFGHTRIRLNGRPCHCGKSGCLEAYIGGISLLEHHPELNCRDVFTLIERLRNGDGACRAVFADAVKILTDALYPALELFGVEFIVLGGKMRDAFDVFDAEFRLALQKYYTAEETTAFTIRPGGEPFPVLSRGAALTARQYFLTPEAVGRNRGLGQSLNKHQ